MKYSLTSKSHLLLILLWYSLLFKNAHSRAAVSPEVLFVDVLAFGANAAGVAAAVTASAQGKHSVHVVEPLQMIGGMAAAGGVALMNQGGCGLTGLAKNWSVLVGEFYGLNDGMPYPPFPRMKESEQAFWKLLRSSSTIQVTTGCHVLSVSKTEGCIETVRFTCNDRVDFEVRPTYVIDASYDGDVMTMAGVDHTHGRESKDTHGETLAGVQIQEWSDLESFAGQNVTVHPFYSNGTLLKYINAEPLLPAGSADDKLMSFQYFVCLSTTPGNQIPFYPPEKYNPGDFELLLRQTEAVMTNGKYPEGPPLSYFGDVQCYDPVVERFTSNRDCLFCCGTGPVNSDQPGLNQGWATATFQERLDMAKQYRYYIQGSLYFMANDPRMPNTTRVDANRYGYCMDEYADYGHFPPQLYVRISNRLLGQTTLTQNNIANPRIKPDGVAMGCWWFDQHTMGRHVILDPKDPTGATKIVRNEGFFRAEVGREGLSCNHPKANCGKTAEGTVPAYNVPFGVMVPRYRKQANNLLVPVCISASSVAYSSTRIENMFMDLGSAAGVAVSDLLDKLDAAEQGACPQLHVQDVNVSQVQYILSSVYQQRFNDALGLDPSRSQSTA